MVTISGCHAQTRLLIHRLGLGDLLDTRAEQVSCDRAQSVSSRNDPALGRRSLTYLFFDGSSCHGKIWMVERVVAGYSPLFEYVVAVAVAAIGVSS